MMTSGDAKGRIFPTSIAFFFLHTLQFPLSYFLKYLSKVARYTETDVKLVLNKPLDDHLQYTRDILGEITYVS